MFLNKSGYVFFANLFTIDTDSFPEINQMRRCKNSYPISGLAHYRIIISRSWSFAVGSGNMNRFEGAVRIANISQKVAYISYPQLDSKMLPIKDKF